MTRAGVAWMAYRLRAAAPTSMRWPYAKQREQFGRPIGGFQLVQDLLVKMLANTTASAALCARLAGLQEACAGPG